MHLLGERARESQPSRSRDVFLQSNPWQEMINFDSLARISLPDEQITCGARKKDHKEE